MNSYELYKSLFEREQIRRKELDDSINIPIGLITLIIGLISYLNNDFSFSYKEVSSYLSILIFILLFIGIFFLSKSYNNLFKGFNYVNLPHTKELREFELESKKIKKSTCAENEESFEFYLTNNFAKISDTNGKINKQRLIDLYNAKTTLIISIILSVILVLIIFFKLL